MSERPFRKYLTWILSAVFWLTIIGGETLIVVYTPLAVAQNHQEHLTQTSQKEGSCGQIQSAISYGETVRYYGCKALFKNLSFIDTYHDTINAIAALLVAVFTYTLWQSTKGLWQASIDQSEFTAESIKEAGRSAKAMEDVAGHLKINADKVVESVEMSRKMGEHQRRVSICKPELISP